MSTLHILFNTSAAGTLKKVLRARGSFDEVVSLTDCLAFGPISTGNFEERSDWLDVHAPIEGNWDWLVPRAEDFLNEISAWAGDRLVWIAPRSACEQCGVQWYFEQTEAPGRPMIIADQPIQFKKVAAVPLGLGELADEYMGDLLDHAPRREWPSERSSPDEWRRLRAEDTQLRIVEGGNLRSVVPSYFDDLILNRCTDQWQKWSRVVGWTMVDAMDQGHHAGDVLLLWRLRELVRIGQIECEGELPGRQHDPENRPNAMLRRVG